MRMEWLTEKYRGMVTLTTTYPSRFRSLCKQQSRERRNLNVPKYIPKAVAINNKIKKKKTLVKGSNNDTAVTVPFFFFKKKY